MINKIFSAVCGLFILSFACYAGFQSGYSHGERDGYRDGEERAWSYYPQMSTDSIVISDGDNTISLNGLTIIGEEIDPDLVTDSAGNLY